MKAIEELNFPSDVKYTDDHEWAKVEGDLIRVGISDYAQDQLGEIVFVEMPETGDTFGRGDEFGSVESVKAVSELFLPVSGEIVEVNSALEDAPELVNTDCYNTGWLVRIKPADLSEMDGLKDRAAYMDMLKG